jgi:hypothetical protein
MLWRILFALVIVLAAFAGSTWVGSTGLLHTLGPDAWTLWWDIRVPRVATGAATTLTIAAATMSPATPPRTESVCSPGVAKVTRAIARPPVKVTFAGRVAAASLELSVAVPV